MKARVAIRYREGVLDPEAVAIGQSLESLGFKGVEKVRREKVIELDLAADDADAARRDVEAMCEKLLANPVIESYAITVPA